MILLVIIALLYLKSIIFKPVNNVLACGLFGYIGAKSNYNPLIIRVLGVKNDARGGDSCGVLVNGNVHRSLGKFTDWIQENDEKLNQESQKIIGHTRKSSSGAVSLTNAHPFLIKEKGRPNLVGVHNGTIWNTEELAKKYGVTKSQVDSETLYRIIHKGHLEVLEDYEGAAALIWTTNDDRDAVYIFKGASPSYSGGSFVKDERPLYLWNLNKVWDAEKKAVVSSKTQGIYFSSIEDSLLLAGANKNVVEEVPANQVLRVDKKGNIAVVKKVNRKDAFHTKTYNYNSNYYSSSNSRTSQAGASSRKSSTFRNNSITSGPTFVGDFLLGGLDKASDLVKNDKEMASDYVNKVYMNHGLYFTGGTVMHSSIPFYDVASGIETTIDVPWYINDEGHFLIPSEAEKQKVEPVYFFRGYLCKNKEAYEVLKGKDPKTQRSLYRYAYFTVPSQVALHSDFLVGKMSSYPVAVSETTTPKNEESLVATNAVNMFSKRADGVYHPPFIKKKYHFKNGDLVKIEKVDHFPTNARVGDYPTTTIESGGSPADFKEEKKEEPNFIKDHLNFQNDITDTFEGIEDYCKEFFNKYPVEDVKPEKLPADAAYKSSYIRLCAIAAVIMTEKELNSIEVDE